MPSSRPPESGFAICRFRGTTWPLEHRPRQSQTEPSRGHGIAHFRWALLFELADPVGAIIFPPSAMVSLFRQSRRRWFGESAKLSAARETHTELACPVGRAHEPKIDNHRRSAAFIGHGGRSRLPGPESAMRHVRSLWYSSPRLSRNELLESIANVGSTDVQGKTKQEETRLQNKKSCRGL
jgi:hypothetical protein